MLEIWGLEVNEIFGFDIIVLSFFRKFNIKKFGRFFGGILVVVKSFFILYFFFIN